MCNVSAFYFTEQCFKRFLPFLEIRKSTENYVMVDLRERKISDPQPPKEMSRATENVHSSMYGQNRKHNCIQKPQFNNAIKQEKNTKSLSLDHTNISKSQEGIHRTHSAKNITKNNRPRPQSLLVTKEDASKAYLRSKSVDDGSKKNVLNCIRTKFVGESISPASSVEKLSRLKEKLLNSGVEEPSHLDSDDESTPLVSDISTPSVSVGHNSAFSPTDKFSLDKKSDSTEYSPISPVSPSNNTVNVSSVCNVVQSTGGTQTVHESCVGLEVKELSNASSEVSLSYYLEAPSKFSNSSLASVGSCESALRTISNSSGISRQNALDPEENFKDLD